MSLPSVSHLFKRPDLGLSTGDQLVAKRKGEKHKRIKCSTLAKLMTENNYEESIYNLNENMS